MFYNMRTSIDIPDDLYKKAKIRAAEQGITMKQLVIRGLQKSLLELDAKPDASSLPTLPRRGRETYELTGEMIHDLLAAEEAKWYGSNR